MTSKISYSKLIKENIRHRGWLAVLSCILLLLLETGYSMLTLEDVYSSYGTILDYEQIRAIFPGMINGNNNILLVFLIFLIAVLCAVTGFSYLHSPEKIDFFHSLPLTRPQWFRISYVSGLFIFLIPYFISSLCTLLVGSAKGILTTEVLAASFTAVLGGILGFLVIYHTAIFAMMLTGKLVTGVLAALVLSVYGSLITELFPEMANGFFGTYYDSFQALSAVSDYLSPFALYTRLLDTTASWTNASGSGLNYYIPLSLQFYSHDISSSRPVLLIFTVISAAALILLSDYLYRIRPSEAAGNALTFPKTAPFIKMLISIPTALNLGAMISIYYGGGQKQIIIISILSVILLCGIIEFIYHMDLRKLLSGKISSLISIAAVLIILCVLHFDLIGYDTWLPKEEALQAMSFDTNSFSSYFDYPYNNQTASWTPDLLNDEDCQITDFKPLYELAEEGIENAKAGITPEEVYQHDSSYEYIAITVRYEKKSGKSVYRTYAVSKEHALNALSVLCQDENYRKALFPVFYLDYDTIQDIQLIDIYNQPESLDLTREQRDALLNAYKKDALNASIFDLQNKMPLGELRVIVPDDTGWNGQIYHIPVSLFYLYDNYENTLALLKEYGYSPRTEIAPEDVVLMTKYEYGSDDDETADYEIAADSFTPESIESPITDPDEIAEILSQIQYASTGILGGNNVSSRSVEITLKGESDPTYYMLP